MSEQDSSSWAGGVNPQAPGGPAGGPVGGSAGGPAGGPAYVSSSSMPNFQAPKSSGGGFKTFILAFLGAALAFAIGVVGLNIYNSMNQSPMSSTSVDTTLGSQENIPINAAPTESTLPEAVASKCLPSLASITVYLPTSTVQNIYGGLFNNSSGSQGQELNESVTAATLGSGVVLSEDGYILTNYHVVAGGAQYTVTVNNVDYEADYVGADSSSDVAILKLRDASGLAPMEIGNSEELVVGEWVMALGSPFGLSQSVSTGIISSIGRSRIVQATLANHETVSLFYPTLIQTDAAINPGNSGGALVNADGKLIGMNTLLSSSTGNYAGVGFAIPINYAIQLAQQIIDGKTPTHAYLGTSLSSVTSELASRYGLPSTYGAYITQVLPGTSAEAAGLEIGDIIIEFDGQTITSSTDLMLGVRGKNPGESVTLVYVRDGEEHEITVTLGNDESISQVAQQSQSSVLR